MQRNLRRSLLGKVLNIGGLDKDSFTGTVIKAENFELLVFQFSGDSNWYS